MEPTPQSGWRWGTCRVEVPVGTRQEWGAEGTSVGQLQGESHTFTL